MPRSEVKATILVWPLGAGVLYEGQEIYEVFLAANTSTDDGQSISIVDSNVVTQDRASSASSVCPKEEEEEALRAVSHHALRAVSCPSGVAAHRPI